MPTPLTEIAARLHYTHLFGDLSGPELRRLAEVAEEIALSPGDVAVHEGVIGEHLYVVTDGLLRAKRRTSDGEQVLGEIYKGGYFGEIALLEAIPRTATVEAASRCTLLRLAKDDIDAVLAERPTTAARLRASLERRRAAAPPRPYRPPVDVLLDHLRRRFGELDETALRGLEQELEWTWLPADTVVMRQDERGDCLYLVLSGRLRVYVERPDGSEIEVGVALDGETIGELALLSNEPRSASVSTVVGTELLRLSRAAFDALVATHPSAMRVFTKLMADRLTRRLNDHDLFVRLRSTPRVSIEECDAIVATEDLVLRNLKITQTYHRLALDLTTLVGTQDVNWCGFGCHASKTAGYAIRREELPLYEVFRALSSVDALAPLLDRTQRVVLQSSLARLVLDVVAAVSDAVSGGNLRIFGDMAPVFARFLRAFAGDVRHDREKLDAFLATLVPGPSDQGGQTLLGSALSRYYEAAFEPDEKRKSELILLGNCEVGLHEQTRVQPDIEEALGAPLRGRLGDDLARLLFENRAWLPERVARALRERTHRLEERALDALSGVVRRMLTRHQMSLRLPGGTVRLGLDLPAARRREMFPDVLRDLEHPELRALFASYDRQVGGGRGTAALDWASLDDRMNFIINLFRSRQHDLSLFTSPFGHAQRQQMAAGLVPATL